MMMERGPVAWKIAALAILVTFLSAGMVQGKRDAQGYMYLERANMNYFNKLENIAAWKPRPWDPDHDGDNDADNSVWSGVKKKEALKLLPEMLAYIKQHIMTPEQIADHVKKVMDEAPRFPKGKKEKAKDPKANPFENMFARQFMEGAKRVQAETSRQIRGNYRGGLIRVIEMEWSYGARDVSQDTEELLYVNKDVLKRSKRRKRSALASNYLGSLEDGTLPLRLR